MGIKKEFTTVTTFSKLVALSLFIILPFVGFSLGIMYQKNQTVAPIQIVKIVQQKDSQKSLLRRCGQLPEEVTLSKQYTTGHFISNSTGLWAPDCRHVVWSVQQGGIEGVPYGGPYEHEGIFLYSVISKQIKKIDTPPGTGWSYYSQLEWKDRDTIVFSTNDQTEKKYVIQ